MEEVECMEEGEVGGGCGASKPAPRAPTPSFCSPSIIKALLRYWRKCLEATRGSKAVDKATSASQPAL
jgi:hypothetical protein